LEQEKVIKTEKSNSFVKNVLMLVCSQILVKVLGLIYKIVITNVEGFGNVGNGYYSAGYQIYALLLTLSSIGIPNVISKLVSEREAVGNHKESYKIFKVSLILFTTIGAIFSLLLFFGAEFIATNILNVPDVKYVLKVLAPAIMLVSASAVFRGYFSGMGTMKQTSISQTLEQFFNCVLSITFVYALIGKEPYIMAAGGNLSTTLAVLISFIYLVIIYKRNKKSTKEDEKFSIIEERKDIRKMVKTILALSIPMTLGSVISVINSLIDTATISNFIQQAYQNIIPTKAALEEKAMELAGLLSKVETITNLPLAVNLAFCTALVPEISSAIARNDKETAERRMSFSIFASIIIILPCAMGLSVLASPILHLLYPTASDGALLLQLATIQMILNALNNTINGGLYGLNKSYVPAIALLIGCIVKFILNTILISNPNINVYGAEISSFFCQLIAFLIVYLTLKKHLNIKLDMKKNIIKPIIATIIMGIIAFFTYTVLNIVIPSSIATIIAIIIAIVVYAICIFKMKILNEDDIKTIPMGDKLYPVLVKLRLF
jgi:stage V sporulation protein B